MGKKTLVRYANLLKALHTASPKERKRMILKCKKDKKFVNCLCECCLNILNGNVHLSASQKRKLNSKKTTLRKICSKRTSLKNKQKLIQKGGFLGAILGPIVSILGGLLGS